MFQRFSMLEPQFPKVRGLRKFYCPRSTFLNPENAPLFEYKFSSELAIHSPAFSRSSYSSSTHSQCLYRPVRIFLFFYTPWLNKFTEVSDCQTCASDHKYVPCSQIRKSFISFYFIHTNSLVPAPFLCNKCGISHFLDECPEPCQFHLPCCNNPSYSATWPCQGCLDKSVASRNDPWDTPSPPAGKHFIPLFHFKF